MYKNIKIIGAYIESHMQCARHDPIFLRYKIATNLDSLFLE